MQKKDQLRPELKRELHTRCMEWIDQRIDTAQKAISEAQDAANEETKSSSGDKYETGRAMMQLEMENNATQLAEMQKVKEALLQISPASSTAATITPGSLVVTSQGSFYIAISVGQVKIDGNTYFVVSPASPIGAKLIGLQSGDKFQFNNKTYNIEHVQ